MKDTATDATTPATAPTAAAPSTARRTPELAMQEGNAALARRDYSAAEAAAILDTTPKAIDNRLYRARNLLRGRLKRWL